MPSLDDVYRKFGEAAEAAQLLETEIGSLLIEDEASRRQWYEEPDPVAARAAMARINRSTLGQLLKGLDAAEISLDAASDVVLHALKERNRLSHSFFRQHNYRRNSESGREVMLKDLSSIHESVFRAYRLALRASGVDLDTIGEILLPTDHLPLD